VRHQEKGLLWKREGDEAAATGGEASAAITSLQFNGWGRMGGKTETGRTFTVAWVLGITRNVKHAIRATTSETEKKSFKLGVRQATVREGNSNARARQKPSYDLLLGRRPLRKGNSKGSEHGKIKCKRFPDRANGSGGGG